MSLRVTLAIAIASIGVVGETAVLRHQLVNCYPFKMFTYPPAHYYQQLGNLGAFGVGALAILIVIVLSRRAPLLAPPAATVLAPFLYVVLVAVITTVLYGWTVPAGTRNFDGYGIGAATGEFVRSAGALAIAGLVVGTISSASIWLATRRNKKHATS